MATGIEVALVKPVVDVLISLFKKAQTKSFKANAEKALTEAIRELLLAPSDLKSAEVKIAVAKAAGIINADLILAEELLQKSKVVAKSPAARAKKAAPAKKTAASAKKATKSKKAPPAISHESQRTSKKTHLKQLGHQ